MNKIILFLLSFVNKAILNPDQVDRFMLSINTVASDIQADQSAVIMGKMSMKELIAKYGHLRPLLTPKRLPQFQMPENSKKVHFPAP